jgi:eukaryotic-like serine/threonine-protein kinase
MVTHPADVASGRYRISGFLGQGAAKRVYAARDTLLDRDVAVALITADEGDKTAAERIRREAQAMGRMGAHPHIVTIYDFGVEDGRPFVVSELMQGGDVRGLLQNAREGRLPVERAVAIGRAICGALVSSHAAGIIHRDIKPGNVWLTAGGVAKLGDFGIAVALDRSRLTDKLAVVGTASYLAPEQATGGEVTPRTDLYSLGVTLYEMVTGRRPFVADDLVAIIYQHIYTPPVAPSWHNPAIPPALESLILHLLAKLPEDRPESAAAVEQALAAIAASPRAGDTDQDTAQSTAPANPLNRLAGGVFVGREREMADLRAGLEEALAGRTAVLLLGGEPGAGKTRTLEELAMVARLRGAPVLWGRCYEDGAPAFWPWVQLIRAWMADRPAPEIEAAMATGAADIAQVVTEVRERLPELQPGPLPEGDQARFRLFDSITTFVRNATRDRPLVLLFDDLQWADTPSLRLLHFLTRELRGARLLIAATYRDQEHDATHPLAHTLAEMTRGRLARRVQVSALSERDVARLIEITVASTPPPALVEAVYRETEGNAFFVTEVVRLLAAEGRLSADTETGRWSITIPQGVRDVVERRLAHLSEGCVRLLTTAAVLGREFEIDVMERLSGLGTDAALELIEEAEAARVVTESPGTVGRYAFTHAIIRETLYDGLSRTRRVHLHRRAGEALVALCGADPGPRLSEIAYHFVAAAPGGDIDTAVTYARRAAHRSLALLAYEDAERHYLLALEALDQRAATAGDDLVRCELLLALGVSRNKADDITGANEAFEDAAVLARRLGLPDRLARAGLGMADIEPAPGVLNLPKIRLLEEALAAMPPGDNPLKVRALARLALELYFGDAAERTTRLGRTAVEMARRVGDPGMVAYALHAERMVIGWADPPGARLAVSTEITTLAEQAGDAELALTGHYWRLSDLAELGDIEAVDVQIELCHARAEALRQPVWRWYSALTRAMRAMLAGRFDEAEQHAQRALQIGQRAHGSTALQTYGGQMLVIRRDQGRLAELEPVVQGMVLQNPTTPAWRAALAFVHSELGREAQAREQFESLAAKDFTDLPRDVLYLVMLTVLTETCAFLQDSARAATLYGLLRPYTGRNLVMANALACVGACSYYLGVLAATMGRAVEADTHFDDALRMHTRMASQPWMARTRYAWAAMLLRRDNPGDRTRAVAHLGHALDAAQSAGMVRLAEQVKGLMASV